MRPTVKLLNNVAYVHTDRINHTSIFRERQLLRTHKENMLLEKRLWDIKPFIRSDDWVRLTINLIIHSFIHSRIYNAPLQEIYSEAPQPSHGDTDFVNGYALYAFDLTADQCEGDHFNLILVFWKSDLSFS